MLRKIFFIFVVALLLSSCETSSPKEIAKAEIEEVFEQIRTAYNFGELSGIMENFHPNFLHNSDDFHAEEIIWEVRLNQYPTLDFGELEIDLHNDFATVEFTLFLDGIEFTEPSSENGDLSYFYSSYNGWILCGNEFMEEFK